MHLSLKFIGLTLISVPVLAGACGGSDDNCDAAGTACAWAGIGERGFNLGADAHRLESKLYYPEDVTFGPDGRGYIVDWNNHRVRRVETDDTLSTVVGTDYEGDGPPQMEDRLPLCAPPGAAGTKVAMNHMTDVEFGPDGKLYIAAWHNNKIRVLDTESGMVTALAGDGYGFQGDGNPACQALFNQPKSLAIAGDGTIYTIDQRNVRIREISPDRTMIKTIAGTGIVGNAGDGGPMDKAEFGFEIGTTPRPAGALVLDGRTLYVADSLNNRIRRINLDTKVIDCIAGASAAPGYSGDGGPALQAQFDFPMDMELGPDGRLYIADRNNHAVRAIDLTSGIVETVAGGRRCNVLDGSNCGDGGAALQLGLYEPYGIAFDAGGNLYVADTHNNRVMKVTK